MVNGISEIVVRVHVATPYDMIRREIVAAIFAFRDGPWLRTVQIELQCPGVTCITVAEWPKVRVGS